MDAKELRIGNSVLDKYGNIKTVFAVLSNGLVFDSNQYIGTPIEWCKPIPLTEEWLEKFGFEKNGLYDYSLPDMSFLVYWDKANRIYLCSRCGEKIPLKYVHKLQNLYFVVKEEELTIKNEH